jgi:hypothetical protein
MNNLFVIAAWEMCFGPYFTQHDQTLRDVLASPAKEQQKMKRLQVRMHALPPEVFMVEQQSVAA